MPLGPEGFAEFVPVSRETLARLEAYADLLTRWSARINLVGRDTLVDLWRRHILDSTQLHRFIPNSARSLIDLGSGAGLPGLVLAILGVSGVELVEADSRKAAFLREAARDYRGACRDSPVPRAGSAATSHRCRDRTRLRAARPVARFGRTVSGARHPLPLSQRRAVQRGIDPGPQSLDNECVGRTEPVRPAGGRSSLATGCP